ncbi:MAG: DUF4916 domain-containing protein [Actinomycetia bacterium]|nr:DUF4916 domain-containing protein [Actinomycetes bacterium]MCP3913075.1 DUF4916 domain-containing protein [Actinomycetes bacterium]MCP4087486.1 DUF4916 domain-containing protein [Actinomycetes bacterium]
MSDQTETMGSWLSQEELNTVRARMPIVYVEAVPVRVNGSGEVEHVGLLLRVMPDETVSRTVVSGRVLYGERVRHALIRHLERDLGPLALPMIPPDPSPFTIAEYFPEAYISGYHDPRQHSVSLAYVVPVEGDCEPSQNALDFTWLTPEEAVSPEVVAEMTGGHDRLVRLGLAQVGSLP